jgi:hypothetical protein
LHSRKVLQKQDFHFKQQTKKTPRVSKKNTISFASVISQAQSLRVCHNDHVYKVRATKQLTDKAKTVETIN